MYLKKNIIEDIPIETIDLIGEDEKIIAQLGYELEQAYIRSQVIETVKVYREDKKALAAINTTAREKGDWKYKVAEWELKNGKYHKYDRYVPLAWWIPVKELEEKGITPIGEEEAIEIRKKRSCAGHKAAATAKKRDEEVNDELGMPPGSKTGKWLRRGEISEEQAERIAEKCSHRHEETDYDNLLKSGVDKETARDLIEE